MIKFLRKEKLFLLFFGLSVIIFLWDVIMLKRIFFYGDYKQQFFPWSMEYANAVKHFTLPFWVANMGCGFPLVAEGQIGPFYPVNMALFFLLPPIMAYSWGTVLHFMLGGIFMYLFCRKIGLKDLAAAIPAILFMFASPYAGCFSNIASLKVLCWFPLVLFTIIKSLEEDKPLLLLWAGLVMGFQLLAGAPQMAFYSISFSVLYFLFILFSTAKPHKAYYIAAFVASVLIAFIISSPQVIVTQGLVNLSNRSTRDLSFALGKSFFPAGILTLIFPNMGEIFEGMVYTGILPLIFAIFAMLYIKKNGQVLFFTALFIVSLLCAFGRYNPLYAVFLKVTNFYLFRIPSKFLFFSAFSLIVLSGFGLQALTSDADNPKRAKAVLLSFTILGASLVILILGNIFLKLYKAQISDFIKQYIMNHFYNPALHRHAIQYYMDKVDNLYQSALINFSFLDKRIYIQFFILAAASALLVTFSKKYVKKVLFRLLVVFIIFFDLIYFSSIGWGFRGNLANPASMIKDNEEIKVLKKDNSLFRVYLFQVDETKNVLQPNLNMYFGIDDIGVYSPLVFKRYIELVGELGCIDDSTGVSATSEKILYKNLALLGLLNVKYIISEKELDNEGLLYLNDIGDGNRLYLNKKFMPRAFIVFKIKRAEKDNVLSLLKSDDFNPLDSAVLEEGLDGPVLDMHEPGREHEATIEDYTNQRVIIKAKLSDDGVLILSDYFYPGWKCYVDGKRARILRADYILRAVYLSRGEHEVKFIY